MITSLQIRGFRGFSSLSLERLGRINLIVGRNNSGKTAVLEAVDCVLGQVWDRTWLRGPWLRGERRPASEEYPKLDHQQLVRVAGLFHGCRIEPGDSFEIRAGVSPARRGCDSIRFRAEVVVMDPTGERVVEDPGPGARSSNPRSLWVLYPTLSEDDEAPLSPMVSHAGDVLVPHDWAERWEPMFPMAPQPSAAMEVRDLGRSLDWPGWEPEGVLGPVVFLGSDSWETTRVLHQLWRGVEASGQGERVLTLLRSLDPRIRRILPGEDEFWPRGASFVVELEGEAGWRSLGSLGEGVRRLLGVGLGLVAASGGVLLVDEIDTGLHYTVMRDLWRLASQAVRDLDVQVFATTHSSDCWKALGRLCEADPETAQGVTAHRVEPGMEHTVQYSAREFGVAAEADIEVR